MARLEFSAKVKDQAFARCRGQCENKACGAKLTTGKFDYDHILPDALGGKPVLANCQVLCEACHNEKTADDIRRIRKADRQRRSHIGATAPAQKIASRGFAKSEKARKREERVSRMAELPKLNRRMFEDIRP